MKKKSQRMVPIVVIASALLFAACGDRSSVASRSAAAWDEAKKNGTPIGGGHEHGGHAATGSNASTADTTAMDHSTMHGATSGMDHSTMAHSESSAVDHSTMQHGAASAMDHAQMQHTASSGVDHSAMQHRTASGMNHSRMQHSAATAMDHSKMQHGTTAGMDHSAMQHGTTAGMDHSAMQQGTTAGMDHSTMQQGTTTGVDHSTMQHTTTTAMDHSTMQHGAAAPASPASTSVDVSRVTPAATLEADQFDAPVPVSVSEAVKAANNVPDGDIRHIVPGQDRAGQPTSRPAKRESTAGHQQHTGASSSAAGRAHDATSAAPKLKPGSVVYACPMHPEVTSDRPGNCPKCGMALVKKK